jgi:ankyrin repeat protein
VLKGHARSTKQHFEEEAVRYLNNEHRSCHQVFKTSTYEQFKNINPDRVDQTCQWALSHPLYQRWRDSATDDLLWISADPGCGKSVLSKSLVDEELRSDADDSTVCYFFFKDNDGQNGLATGLCALLHQLFQQQPHLLQHAIPAWNRDGSKLQQETDELWRILLAATSDVAARDTICVLDALDECRDRDRSDLIAKLARFHEDAGSRGPRQSWLKFIVTSRPYDDIQRGFEQIPSSLPAIRLRGEQENDQIYAEINSVIHVRVSQLANELRLRESTSVYIEQTLLAMKHRTYLWLHLAIDDIRKTLQDSLRPDEEPVKSVPSSVEGAYEKILARIAPEQHQKVKLILQIIVGARRPLAVGEMALALGLATSKQHRTCAEAQLDSGHLGKQLRHWCGLFVFINHSRIYLIHQTAREFLVARQDYEQSQSFAHNIWRHCLQQAEMEQTMTSICTRCLNLKDREVQPSAELPADAPEAEDSRKEFIEYCCEWWTAHYSSCQDASEEDTFQDVLSMYNTEGEAFKFWFGRFWTRTRCNERARSMTPIRLAALTNHNRVLEHFLDKEGMDLDAMDEVGRSALHWASELGHDKVVQMLLSRDADVNIKGRNRSNPLQAAIDRGYEEIVQMLLDKGADFRAKGVDPRNRYSWNALYVASSKGYRNIVQMLLGKGADVNAAFGENGSALQAASAGGHHNIVRMLLDKGVDVNLWGGRYRNALQAASAEGHDKVVQMLLDRGAGVDAHGKRCDNALEVASARGRGKIVQMLLDRSEGFNAQSRRFGNALQAASEGGHDKIVQMLLDRGADVNAQGGDYGNALQAASHWGHDKIVQMLLDGGADVNAQGGLYGNALQAASARGHEKIVQVLLDKGADVNADGGLECSALQAASARGRDKVVQMLLNRSADVNTQGGFYGSALQAASYRGHDKVVQLLLDSGADTSAQGGSHGNALQAASEGGYDEIVQMLLDKGAGVNAQGGDHGNALQAALREGHVKVVQILLDRGADLDAHGSMSGNALQEASYRGYEKIVQMLLDKDVHESVESGDHGKALLAALYEGHAQVVRLFLDRGTHANAETGPHSSILYAASSRDRENDVQILLDRAINFNIRDKEYGRVLQEAAYLGHDKTVQMLLDRGADVNAQGGPYGSALLAASHWGHNKVVQRLLEQGADPNAQDGGDSSALQAALEGGYDKIVQMLLDRGARPTAKVLFSVLSRKVSTTVRLLVPNLAEDAVLERDANHGKSPLHWAAELGYTSLANHCLGLGADVDATDKYGETALHYAAENGHLDIVQILIRADANRTIVDSHGRTALDCAQGAGPGGGRRSHQDIVAAYLQQ